MLICTSFTEYWIQSYILSLWHQKYNITY